jgi:hypothetical protein
MAPDPAGMRLINAWRFIFPTLAVYLTFSGSGLYKVRQWIYIIHLD